jgi:hypothetical protein
MRVIGEIRVQGSCSVHHEEFLKKAAMTFGLLPFPRRSTTNVVLHL